MDHLGSAKRCSFSLLFRTSIFAILITDAINYATNICTRRFSVSLCLSLSLKVNYFNYFQETGFNEDPVSRNMRPTMPQVMRNRNAALLCMVFSV